jgi:hypothetical protein
MQTDVSECNLQNPKNAATSRSESLRGERRYWVVVLCGLIEKMKTIDSFKTCDSTQNYNWRNNTDITSLK